MYIESSADIFCTVLFRLQMTAMKTTQSYLITLFKDVRSSPTLWTEYNTII